MKNSKNLYSVTRKESARGRFIRPAQGAAALLAAASITGAQAAEQAPAPAPAAGAAKPSAAVEAAKPEPSLYDQIWGYTELYKNKENPVIQSFKLSGRFQVDYSNISSDQGSYDEWNIRRFRFGARSQLFQDFTVHVEADLNPQEATPVYQRLTDAYLGWSRDKRLAFKLGKQSAAFTMDGTTSSTSLLAIDRGNLANNLWFPDEYTPGFSAKGVSGKWNYQTGIYSSGSVDGEFGDFDGGVFWLSTLGYDFAKDLGVDKAVLAADYVYNEQDSQNNFTRRLQHIASLHFDMKSGKFGLQADIAAGDGYLGSSDLWGGMVMPSYDITKEFQVVGRYTYVTSENSDGVRLPRYASQFVSGRGDEYNEGYLGLNYYFYSHKLKLQTGVAYVNMKDDGRAGGDIEGWDWTTGLRISW